MGHGLNELEKDYDIACYIVSKCYLLSDKTKYKENGSSEKEYEVVFPYQVGQHYSWERVIPKFNLMNYVCTNSNIVEKVFDNYEEALETATQKNKKLCDETWSYLPYSENLKEQISEKIEIFNDKLSRYKMLEQQILVNTSDLEQSNVRELGKLIRSDKGKIKLLSCNLYEYLKFSSISKFIVYSVSPEQYDKLTLLIDKSDVCDATKVIENDSPILCNQIKEQNVTVINQNGNVLYHISECGNLKNNDEQKILSVELNSIDDDMECLYTTETLEDILLSFKGHESIDLNKVQGPILKKTLFDVNKK